MNDVHALAEVVMRPQMRLPQQVTTTEAYVGTALRAEAAAEDGAGDNGNGKRRISYDETQRRAKRRRTTVPLGYMERNARRVDARKRGAMEMGAVAISRVVAGRYEWRDAEYPAYTDKALWSD